MRPSSTVCALAILLSAVGSRAGAQAPCSSSAVLADSAREEVVAVLTSDGTLAKEIRQEQGIADVASLRQPTLVRDRFVCAKMAGTFDHTIPPGVSFVVLRVGPLYYAREPNQKLGTGIIADSAFKVVARLGVAMDGPATSTAGARRP